MFDLKAKAHQTRTGIYVEMTALLANTCMHAKVGGTYPGTIVHIVDPGFAEIYLEEWRDPGPIFCAEHLTPWHDKVMLHDFGHDKVMIYYDKDQHIEVSVTGQIEGGPIEHEWIVTALVGPATGPFMDCALRPADAIYPAIYRRVFGPDSKDACEAFRAKQCQPVAF